MWLVLAPALLSTVDLEADVAAAGGDYVEVGFDVPAGTQEIQISHSDGSEADVLDWGVWSPDGFRGWGGGLVEDAIIGPEQSSRGYLPGPITAGTWTLVIGKAKLDGDGGRYTVQVRCFDEPSLAVQPRAAYQPAVVKQGRRWYKGDFHVHSVQSGDSDATFEQIAALARQRGLDFVNLSDHNTTSQHALQAAFMASQPDVLLLRGAEVTTYAGHGNAVGISSYVDHRIGHAGRAVTGILDDIAAQGAIFLVNHPELDLGELCIGCAWRHPDTDWSKVAGIELITGNYALGEVLFVPRVIERWDELLDGGARIAAVGGSDDHRAGRATGPTDSPIGSPTTLVLADDLSEPAIVDAVRRGRTIVQLRGPDDPRVGVTLRTETGAAAEIGDAVAGIDRVALTIQVTGGAGMFAQVWHNGTQLEPQLAIAGDDVALPFEHVPGAGDHRYRVELVDGGGSRVVVTSHFYVTAIAPAGEPAGCCGAGGDPGAAALALAVAVPLLRRRRRVVGVRGTTAVNRDG